MPDEMKEGEKTNPQNLEWKSDFKPGPSEEELKRFQGPESKTEMPDIRMDVVTEPDPAELQFRLEQEESIAKRDAQLNRLTNAETTKDIYQSLSILRELENFDTEGVDPYSMKFYIQTAKQRAEIFGMDNETLVKQRIYVKVKDKKGKEVIQTRVPGYTIKVDKRETTQTQVTEYIDEFPDDEPGGKGTKTKIWKRTKKIDVIVDTPDYGTDEDRKVLENSFKGIADMLETRMRINTLFKLEEEHVADLDGWVTLAYTKLPRLSNEMISKIFKMPDIRLITEETPENEVFGERVNHTMRLLTLVAKSETKEKMQEIMSSPGFSRLVSDLKLDDNQVIELFGEVDEWLSKEKRDPSQGGKGAEAIKDEKDVRGTLTKHGNIYTRGLGAVDQQAEILKKISFIVRDPDAVIVGSRLFKLFGLADEFGLEKYGELPKAEDIMGWFDGLEGGKKTFDQWEEQAKEWSKLFSLPGEPVGSDLSKIMWPMYYRLKDILKTRPTGPIYTIDKLERLTLSLPNLTVMETENGYRSVMEQWWPVKGEKAKNLGEMDWTQVKTPEGVDFEALEGNAGVKKSSEVEFIGDKGARDGVWGLYVLFNFLAGSDNPLKRPWAFLNFEDYNPNDFLKENFWTNKIKFLGIVLNELVVAEGDWRKQYVDFAKSIKEPKKRNKAVRKALKKQAEKKVSKAKRDWWKGVKKLAAAKNQWEAMKLSTRQQVGKNPYLMDRADFLAARFGFRVPGET